MTGLYERIPAGIRWALFLPAWLGISAGTNSALKLAVYNSIGQTLLGNSILGVITGIISTSLAYLFIPRAKYWTAVGVTTCHLLYAIWLTIDYPNSGLDAKWTVYEVVAPYYLSVIGCLLATLVLRSINQDKMGRTVSSRA